MCQKLMESGKEFKIYFKNISFCCAIKKEVARRLTEEKKNLISTDAKIENSPDQNMN